jgi:hypothetical protein
MPVRMSKRFTTLWTKARPCRTACRRYRLLLCEWAARGQRPRKIKWSLLYSHDLGALETEAIHQTLLVEIEGVDAAMHGIGSEAAGHSFIHDDDARAGADLPARLE